MNARFYIWTWKHGGQWWRSGQAGYTPHLSEAGLYDPREAGEIVARHVFPPGHLVLVHEVGAAEGGPPVIGPVSA